MEEEKVGPAWDRVDLTSVEWWAWEMLWTGLLMDDYRDGHELRPAFQFGAKLLEENSP